MRDVGEGEDFDIDLALAILDDEMEFIDQLLKEGAEYRAAMEKIMAEEKRVDQAIQDGSPDALNEAMRILDELVSI